jgi:RNA polymerase sigma factor (sigma-70 family)
MTLANILRRLSSSSADQQLDGDLVSRFVSTQDEAAFAEILRRHGPMVYGVCRRILGVNPDADDAFQAVFLVLARKANTIRPPGMVGNWLHGVAVRTANKARVMNARRVNRDRKVAAERVATVSDQFSTRAETLELIDAELAELPEVYRAVLVACDLNGKSRSEAARQLGWPEGTVASRLAKARELLAERLRKRGVTLGLGAFATVLVPQAMASTTLAAVRELLTFGTASAVAPVAQQLSEEVIKMMTVAKVKLLAIWMMALTFIAGAATMVADAGDNPGPAVVKTQKVNAPIPKDKDEGLLWTRDYKSGTLTAYQEDGTKVLEVPLKADRNFIDFSDDGETLLFLAKKGQLTDDKHGLTLHLGKPSDLSSATDTGIECKADREDKGYVRYFLTRDKNRVVRQELTQNGRRGEKPQPVLFKHTIIDLKDKTETAIKLPDTVQILRESLDGKEWLALHYNDDPTLPGYRGLRIPVSGGKPVPICDTHNLSFFVASPDDRSQLAIGVPLPLKGFKLYHVTAGKATEIEAFSDFDHRNLLWSPAGKRYAIKKQGDADIFVGDVTGKNRRKLFTIPDAGKETFLIRWFPKAKINAPVPKEKDEGVILLSSFSKDKPMQFIKPDGKEVKLVKTGGWFRPYNARISADGKRAVYMALPGPIVENPNPKVRSWTKFAIHWLDLEADEPTEKTIVEEAYNPSVVISTDGKTIYYSHIDQDKLGDGLKNGELEPFETWAYDIATEKKTRIKLPAHHKLLEVSADGKLLLTKTSEFQSQKQMVHVVPLSTLKPEPLSNTPLVLVESPRFSPDGKKVVWNKVPEKDIDEKTTGVFITDIATKQETKVNLPKGVNAWLLSWSPNGKQLAMCRSAPGDICEVTVCDLDGSNAKVIAKRGPSMPGTNERIYGLDWQPVPQPKPAKVERPAPVPKVPEWKEVDKIEFTKGKVTSVVYSPSGKVIGIARDNGLLSFHRHDTRQFITNMDIAGEKGITAATFTTLAFKPTPHPKLGDVFAVTHKNGVKFGTIGLGIFDNDAALVEGIPINWSVKDLNANQLKWLGDESLVASNGKQLEWRFRLDGKPNKLDFNWEIANGKLHSPIVLEAIPGHNDYFLTNDIRYKATNIIDVVVAPPGSSPQAQLKGHGSRPTAAVMSKDGKRLITADMGGTLIVWEGEKLAHKEKSRIELGEGVAQLALAEDGKTLAVLRRSLKLLPIEWPPYQLELFVFDLTDLKAKPKPIWEAEVKRRGFSHGPLSLIFAQDGKTLLAAFGDPYVSDKDAKSLGVKVFELH